MLLCAQWVGLHHSVAHAGWQAHPTRLVRSTDAGNQRPDLEGKLSSNGDQNKFHSCAAFDAASMADALHAALPIIVPKSPKPRLAQWTAFASWDAPILLSFLSRAPPHA